MPPASTRVPRNRPPCPTPCPQPRPESADRLPRPRRPACRGRQPRLRSGRGRHVGVRPLADRRPARPRRSRLADRPGLAKKAMVDLTALGGGPFLTLLTLPLPDSSSPPANGAWRLRRHRHRRRRPGRQPPQMDLRPRPAGPGAAPVSVDSASFPSAHAMNSAVTFLTLGVLLSRTQTDQRLKAYLMGSPSS